MLLWLLDHWHWIFPAGRDGLIARGLAGPLFRAALSGALAFLFVLLIAPVLIEKLRRWAGERIKSDSARLRRLHASKAKTPTMGGLLVIGAVAVNLLLLGDVANPLLQAGLVVAIGMACIGAADDLIKLRTSAPGLSARVKMAAQICVSLAAALLVHGHYASIPGGLECRLPIAGVSFWLGFWHLPLVVTVIVASSNAVNLTDGLDGLAAGCLAAALGTLVVVSYSLGHPVWAAWFGLRPLAGTAETLVLASATLGAVLAFLWFNRHPAQVFMGNTGSLALGGLLGLIAAGCRQELLLLIVGGVFVMEAMSVMVQVGWYKWRGRRVFLCAPLHHHFEFLGWSERRIVAGFWLAAVLCALLGLAVLKFGGATRAPSPGESVSASTVHLPGGGSG